MFLLLPYSTSFIYVYLEAEFWKISRQILKKVTDFAKFSFAKLQFLSEFMKN